MIAGAPVIDLGQRLGKVSGYGDVLAWSEYDARDATFSLVVRREGQASQRLDIATRNRPFDVDIGPDRDGRPALVYSRCRKDPKRPQPGSLYLSAGLPPYSGGRDCDIYKYSLTAGRERRLTDISMRSANEFMPSIWRGTVAFVREYSPGRRLLLYLNRREGSQSRRLHGSRLGDEIASLDLRGRRVAYETSRLTDDCDRSDVLTVNDSADRRYISIVEPGRRRVIVAASCNNDSRQTRVAGGVWSGSTLLYATTSGKDYEAGKLVALAGRDSASARHLLGLGHDHLLCHGQHPGDLWCSPREERRQGAHLAIVRGSVSIHCDCQGRWSLKVWLTLRTCQRTSARDRVELCLTSR